MGRIDWLEITAITDYTIDRIANYKNWWDALLLYTKYLRQYKLQWTNQTYSTDVFMMNWLWWGELRFRNAKTVLKELWLIEQITKKDNWLITWHYIRVFQTFQDFNEQEATEEPTISHSVENPECGEWETNTNPLNINTNPLNINTNTGEVEKSDTAIPKKTKEELQQESFDKFYEAYPRKENRKWAFRAWLKLSQKDQTDAFEWIAKMKKYHPRWQWDWQFIPHPATYLNNERWKDQVDTTRVLSQEQETVKPEKIAGYLRDWKTYVEVSWEKKKRYWVYYFDESRWMWRVIPWF